MVFLRAVKLKFGLTERLTQMVRLAVAEGVLLVARDVDGREDGEAGRDERFQSRCDRVRRVEQVVDLLHGGPQDHTCNQHTHLQSSRPSTHLFLQSHSYYNKLTRLLTDLQ